MQLIWHEKTPVAKMDAPDYVNKKNILPNQTINARNFASKTDQVQTAIFWSYLISISHKFLCLPLA